MTAQELLGLASSILFSLGGGAVIVAALSYWLGGIWARRILKQYELTLAYESDVLTRRRNIYSKLVMSMRTLVKKHDSYGSDKREEFLASYDEASVWAPDEVMEPIGVILDLLKKSAAAPDSVNPSELEAAYVRCITAIRNDAGFPTSQFKYRLVSF